MAPRVSGRQQIPKARRPSIQSNGVAFDWPESEANARAGRKPLAGTRRGSPIPWPRPLPQGVEPRFGARRGTNSRSGGISNRGGRPTWRFEMRFVCDERHSLPAADHAGPARYGSGAIGFHWTVAALIVFLGALGLLFDDIPKESRPFWINVHGCVGLIYFALVIARLVWRATHTPPELPSDVGEFSDAVQPRSITSSTRRWFSFPYSALSPSCGMAGPSTTGCSN